MRVEFNRQFQKGMKRQPTMTICPKIPLHRLRKNSVTTWTRTLATSPSNLPTCWTKTPPMNNSTLIGFKKPKRRIWLAHWTKNQRRMKSQNRSKKWSYPSRRLLSRSLTWTQKMRRITYWTSSKSSWGALVKVSRKPRIECINSQERHGLLATWPSFTRTSWALSLMSLVLP